jgi:hypothetical protein
MAGGLALERAMTDLNRRVLSEKWADRYDDEELKERYALELAPGWFEASIRYGATGWNLVDDDGPVPFDVQVVIDDYAIGRPVADVASDLYTDAVMDPLASRLSARSPTGSTNGTTSPRKRRTSKPLRSSSPATSAGSRQLDA